jgi:hypothetical protein
LAVALSIRCVVPLMASVIERPRLLLTLVSRPPVYPNRARTPLLSV